MGRKVSEVTRFLWYMNTLSGDTRRLVADLVTEQLRPYVTKKAAKKKGATIPADSQIEKASSAAKQ